MKNKGKTAKPDVVDDKVFNPAFNKFIDTVREAAQEFTDTTNMDVHKLILYKHNGKYHSVDVL